MTKFRIAAYALISVLSAAGCGDDGINKLPDGGTVDAGVDAPPAAPGQLRLSANTADFGSVVVNQTSAPVVITVANIGMGPTGSISSAIAGGSGSNFAVASTTCTTLAPAATCTINVTFTPTSMGAKSASLAVTASPGGTVMAALDGIGIAPGALMIAPSTHSFGNVLSGQTSSTQTFTVTNTGGVASGALTTTTAGSNPGEFTKVTDTCNGMTLAANATCALTVRFAPQTTGAKFATFTVAGAPGGMVSAAVNGFALAPAQLAVNPPASDFGSVVVGSSSANVTFNVVNIGGVATGALSQTLTGAGSGEFTILSSTCNLAVLQPGGGCSVIARFTPTAAGAATATLTFNGTPGGTQQATLTGTGIAAGALVIAPSTHAFPNTNAGGTSGAQAFTVTNNGGSTTGPLLMGLTGTDAGQFTITGNTCPVGSTGLAPTASCIVSVAFSPTTEGVKAAILSVSSTPGGTVTASLNGNAVPAARLAITPALKDFGSVGVGGQTAYQVFTIQNLGGTTTGAPTVALTGTNPAQFTNITDCAAGLAPLQTCTVSVRFMPTAIGNFAANLVVSASPGGSVTANVFGQGVDPAALSVNPSSLPFPGITLIGDTSIQLTFTVTNNGGSATGPLSVTRTGANSGDFNIVGTTCTSLAPAGTCAVTVSFAPTGTGARGASITVGGTPGGSVSVAVSGDALPRLEIIEVDEEAPVTPFDFGTATVNTPEPRLVTVVLRNNTEDDAILNLNETLGVPPQFFLQSISCNGGKGKNPLIVFGGPITALIQSHDICVVGYSFRPTTVGAKTGSVVFDIGPSVLDQATQGFLGNGAEGLSLTAVTTSNYGPTAVDSTSPALQFRVTNANDAPTTGVLTTTLLQTARFRITNDACAGMTLGDGDSCLITVVFEPVLLGPDQAVLAVSATPGGEPSINLNGTGVTGFTVGGTVTGHTGSVTIQNNGYDNVIVLATGSTFTFTDRVGGAYSVTVVSSPAGQTCTVTSGATGTVNNANVNDVVVTCVTVPVPTVLVVAAVQPLTWAADVRTKLLAEGFTTVDTFDAFSGTPSLATLQQYDSILVFSDYGFADSTLLGDRVADYFDGGGRVVVAVFANASVPLRGRFLSGNYLLLQQNGQENPTDSLGVISEPGSPLMADVNTLSAVRAYKGNGAPINGGIVVASWAGGRPLVVRGTINGRNRVDLNFYPPSSAARSDFWTGDGAKLLRNALKY